MGIICLTAAIILIFLMYRGKKEKIPQEWEKSGYLGLLQRCALFLYRGWSRFEKGREGMKGIRASRRQQIGADLRALYPGVDRELLHCKYQVEKITICLAAIQAGIIISFLAWLQGIISEGVIVNEGIQRNPWGKGSKQVTLRAEPDQKSLQKGGKIQTEELQMEIEERRYSEKELDSLYAKLRGEGAGPFLGRNKSPETITENLVLPDSLEEYPFQIRWSSNQYRFVDSYGTLGKEIPEIGAEVVLSAELAYYDWRREYEFHVWVYPPLGNEGTVWREKLESELEESQRKTEDQDMFLLPAEVEGIKIKWEEKKENKSAVLLLISIGGMAAVYIGKDRDLQKLAEGRNKEMLILYPEIVQKLTLLLGAGLTVRSAWFKMSDDYERSKERGKGKKYVYEEMLLSRREMESGVPESISYGDFAKRCRLPCYLKLGSLLTQNLKKGSAGLQQMLQSEAAAAFEERKSMARREGEEAETKLLIPMMMMMGIVMLIVMIPAFLSFTL